MTQIFDFNSRLEVRRQAQQGQRLAYVNKLVLEASAVLAGGTISERQIALVLEDTLGLLLQPCDLESVMKCCSRSYPR